jgi:hypothetical protein
MWNKVGDFSITIHFLSFMQETVNRKVQAYIFITFMYEYNKS